MKTDPIVSDTNAHLSEQEAFDMEAERIEKILLANTDLLVSEFPGDQDVMFEVLLHAVAGFRIDYLSSEQALDRLVNTHAALIEITRKWIQEQGGKQWLEHHDNLRGLVQ